MGANAGVVEQAYASFARGDIPAVLALVHDDVDWTSPRTLPHGGEFHGPSEVVKFFELIGAKWDPLNLDIRQVDEIGDLVVGVVQVDGRLRDGAPAGYGAVHVFRIRDGRIESFHEYVDTDTIIA